MLEMIVGYMERISESVIGFIEMACLVMVSMAAGLAWCAVVLAIFITTPIWILPFLAWKRIFEKE